MIHLKYENQRDEIVTQVPHANLDSLVDFDGGTLEMASRHDFLDIATAGFGLAPSEEDT